MKLHTQLFMGKEKPTKNKLMDVKNQSFVKPSGGLWTSTYEEKKGSDWTSFCENNHFKDIKKHNFYLLEPEKDIKIYTIDKYNDLASLMENYKENDFDNPFGHFSFLRPFLDFEKISQDYDGIHLTSRGQFETRMSRPESLYGWDVESTLWFRWCFSEVKQIELILVS